MTTGISDVADLSAGSRGPPATITSTWSRPDELGGEPRESLLPALAAARLGHEMLSVDVAELAQSAQQRQGVRVARLGSRHLGCREPRAHDPDPEHLARRLGQDGPRRRDGPQSQMAEDGAPFHQSLTFHAYAETSPGVMEVFESEVIVQARSSVAHGKPLGAL